MHVAEFDPRDVVEDLLQARTHMLAPSVVSVIFVTAAAVLTLARNRARLQVVRLGCAQADTIVWSNMDEPLPAVVQVRSHILISLFAPNVAADAGGDDCAWSHQPSDGPQLLPPNPAEPGASRAPAQTLGVVAAD
jgi:hypothetical protein